MSKDKLSSIQKGIYFSQVKHIQSPHFNIGGYALIEEEINIPLFINAIYQTLHRKDIIKLKYNFFWNEDENYEGKYTVDYVDYSHSEKADVLCLKWINSDIKARFGIYENLLKIKLLKSANNKIYWYVKAHHIIFDGFSMNLFFKTVIENFFLNEKKVLKEGQKDFYEQLINAEAKYLKTNEYFDSLKYWKERLETVSGQYAFNSCLLLRASNPSAAERIKIKLPRHVFDEIQNFCQTNNLTITHYFLGVIYSLNQIYNNKPFAIELPILNRTQLKYKNTFEPFVKNLPFVFSDYKVNTFTELLSQIKRDLNECYRNSKFPVFNLYDELTKTSPFFNISFSYQKLLYESDFLNYSPKITYLSCGFQQEDIQIHLLEYSSAEELNVVIDYKKDSFYKPTILGLIKNLEALILNSYKNETQPILSPDNIIASEEREIILKKFSNYIPEEFNFKEQNSIISRFKVQVSMTPNATAVAFRDKSISYEELDQKSDHFAFFLFGKHIKGNIAAVHLEKSEKSIIAMLGILKCGMIYLPLDQAWPKQRIRTILNECQAHTIVDDTFYNQFESVSKKAKNEVFETALFLEDIAYIIYTSGSTGTPKGVIISHKSLLRKIESVRELFKLERIISCLTTNLSFDVSLLEVFLPLISGGIVIIPDQNEIASSERTWNLILNKNVNILQATPSYLRFLMEGISDANMMAIDSVLKYICIGGETLPVNLFDRVKKTFPSVQLNNHYGPTETTIDALVLQDIKEIKRNLIGKPLKGTEIYILDEGQKLLPIGVEGEICIGGSGVSYGYINDELLTKEKFVQWSCANLIQKRLYRSGDRGRWTPDGNIEFLGRTDNQIKIRGYRIEIEEIENALNRMEKINSSCIVVSQNQKSETILVAYVNLRIDLHIEEVKAFLLNSLPPYMIPNYFVKVESLPLKQNGKIDKSRLPLPKDLDDSWGTEYVPPRNDIEKSLVEVYEEVLKKQPIGVKDDFFALGGNSIKLILIESKLKERNYAIAVNDIFASPVIEDLAKKIKPM